jgi:hypothetical protein
LTGSFVIQKNIKEGLQMDNGIALDVRLPVGMSIDGLFALIYIPPSGKETREIIKHIAAFADECASDNAQDAKESAYDPLKRVREGTS